MRSFIYDSIGRICVLFAGVSDWTSNLIVWAVVKTSSFAKVSFAHFCMWLLMRVDSKRVKEEKQANENEKTQLELVLMQSAIRVKENALDGEDWTEEHSEALNMIGLRLIHECDWEPAAVHRYFKPLVESVEGLDYGGA